VKNPLSYLVKKFSKTTTKTAISQEKNTRHPDHLDHFLTIALH